MVGRAVGRLVIRLEKGVKTPRIGKIKRLSSMREVKPDPEVIRARILKRWEKLGRRAKLGELVGVALEEEFD